MKILDQKIFIMYKIFQHFLISAKWVCDRLLVHTNLADVSRMCAARVDSDKWLARLKYARDDHYNGGNSLGNICKMLLLHFVVYPNSSTKT